MKYKARTIKEAQNLKIIVFLINLALLVMELIATIQSVSVNHWSMFEFYTIDSNLLTLCSSTLILLYLIGMPNTEEAPRAISYMRYLSVCRTTLTFLVVVCYLSPTPQGRKPRLQHSKSGRNARFSGVFPFYNIVFRQVTRCNILVKKVRFVYGTDSYSKTSDFSKSF